MSFIQAIILGIIQGLTEFFPVSSSAHLRLTKWFLGVQDSGHLFDLICHTGTLLALLIYLRKEVWSILKDPKKIGLYTVALAPLVPAYVFLKPLRVIASDPKFLGYSLFFTAMLLFGAGRKKGGAIPGKWGDVLWIGVMQSIALIPGVSRSGSTIAGARFCGWSWLDGAKFSFLLSIPTILGGEVLETMKGFEGGGVGFSCYAAGFTAAFGVGMGAVRLVFWIYEREMVKPFAWYCMIVGCLSWAIFNG